MSDALQVFKHIAIIALLICVWISLIRTIKREVLAIPAGQRVPVTIGATILAVMLIRLLWGVLFHESE